MDITPLAGFCIWTRITENWSAFYTPPDGS